MLVYDTDPVRAVVEDKYPSGPLRKRARGLSHPSCGPAQQIPQLAIARLEIEYPAFQ